MGAIESGDRSGWRVAVDQNRCTGSSMCEGIASGHFAVVNGVSRPRVEVVAPADEVREAAGMCPVEAITVFDTVTGTEVPPKF